MESQCDYVCERLSAWLDGELTEAERAAVAAHLEACSGCRRELAQLSALDAALESLSAPVPPLVAERVLARIGRPRRRGWRSLALAASLIMVIVLGGTMARDFYPWPLDNVSGAEIVALEDFHDFPQGSLGSVLASYQAEEGNGT